MCRSNERHVCLICTSKPGQERFRRVLIEFNRAAAVYTAEIAKPYGLQLVVVLKLFAHCVGESTNRQDAKSAKILNGLTFGVLGVLAVFQSSNTQILQLAKQRVM